MNAFVVSFFCVAVSVASAGLIGLNPAAHIPSGSIGVSKNGAVVAGPAGSVRTDNGLHGHGAGAQLSGPSGDVRTRGGHVELVGPGNGHGDDGAWGGENGNWGGDNGNWGGENGNWEGDNGNWGGNDGAWGGNNGAWGGDNGNWGGDNDNWDGDDGQWRGEGAWGGVGHGVAVVAPAVRVITPVAIGHGLVGVGGVGGWGKGW